MLAAASAAASETPKPDPKPDLIAALKTRLEQGTDRLKYENSPFGYLKDLLAHLGIDPASDVRLDLENSHFLRRRRQLGERRR